jgi:hypothetical protein
MLQQVTQALDYQSARETDIKLFARSYLYISKGLRPREVIIHDLKASNKYTSYENRKYFV